MVLLIDGEKIELDGRFGSSSGTMIFCRPGDDFYPESIVESWRWSYRTKDKFIAYVNESLYFEEGMEIVFIKQK